MKDLIELDGVGPKTSLLFNKLGIYNINDLVSFYPRRYDVLKRTDVNNILDNGRVVLDGVVEGQPRIIQLSANLKKVMFRITDNFGIYNICVYNQVYLLKELRYGIKVVVIGKYDRLRNTIVASEVRLGSLPKEVRIEPIYGSTDGLNHKIISRVIDCALKSDIEIVDYIPDSIVSKYKFPSKLWAIREMHHPSSRYNYRRAKQRLKYEEFFWYLYRIKELKNSNLDNDNKIKGKEFDNNKVKEFIKKLSFELTKDQLITIDEIMKDMQSNYEMNRLVQGDVGSGKTIVAFVATYMNYLSGYQTALMVPTEILAVQHFKSALELFKKYDIVIEMLTSKLTKKKRNDILRRLANGEINFIIGTQSLIQKDIVYKKLGLIIADEQHRFGVNQRKLLKEKGVFPDILSMSATPIPRTYALTIYGDMDVSSIKTKPKGRKEVSTLCKSEKDIFDVLKMMKAEIDKGHQVYVVVPAIDGDAEDLDNVIKVEEKMRLAFGKVCKIGCVHGGMDSDIKANIMSSFEDGGVKILISTTVIEVGVNVPNASMIVIFKANLFGLSTLHQLRGRVGRGDIQSYCILLSKEPCERLEFLAGTSDGFLISEYDFKNRGGGDIFGIRQSGQAEFKLADIKLDYELLVRVKEDVDNYFDCNKYSEFKRYLEEDNCLN